MHRRSLRALLLPAWTLVVAALPCAAIPRQVDGTPEVAAAPALSAEAALAASVLRASRSTPKRAAEEIVSELAAPGPALVEPLLDMLIGRSIPALAEGESAQALSEPQRGFILGALRRWSPQLSIDAAETRLATADDAAHRVAAVWVYSAVGDARHLDRAAELSLAPPAAAATSADDAAPVLTPEAQAAFRAAATAILARDAASFSDLSGHIERSPEALGRDWILALGAARDPRGIPTLTRQLQFHEELRPLIVPQLRALGPPAERVALDEECAALRPCLADARRQLRAEAARTLGVLEDEEALPRLIDLLDEPDATTREAALWSLRRMSRLEYPAKSALWRAWYDEETRWWNGDGQVLVRCMKNGPSAERAAAIAKLARRTLYRDEIGEHMADTLTDRDPVVRQSACQGLGQLGRPMAARALVQALGDEDEAVRGAAHGALERIAGGTLPRDAEACRIRLRL